MRLTPTSRIDTAPHPMRRIGDAVPEAAVASTALVAVAPAVRTAPLGSSWSRPDPTFIAHLIATAEQSPQTRVLRRADVADVQAAYRAVANQNGVTGRTQKVS